MKICICTLPIRHKPTDSPPVGAMAIIQAIRKVEEDVRLYNLDWLRPSPAQLEEDFARERFDVIGISAIVSTSYGVAKSLCRLIRSVSPETTIVVGGHMAASAELLLRKCEVDLCVVGDGELIVQDLIRALRDAPADYDRLREIKGLCFLDEGGKFHFTGYGPAPGPEDLEWPDYAILEKDGGLDYYLGPSAGRMVDGAIPLPEVDGNYAFIMATKGCVARCTYCHRWERGYRVPAVDDVVKHIRYLRDRHDVRFLSFNDENFGSDRKFTHELVERLGEMGMQWQAMAVRVSSVSPEILKHWKENGCSIAYFGFESGSQRMLEVMEKKTTVQTNADALRWMDELDMATSISLVLAMPGETDETIRETIDFLRRVSRYVDRHGTQLPSVTLVPRYVQYLPGTPLYEYAREHGLIGPGLEGEEEYLLSISDVDPTDTRHIICAGFPLLKALMWRAWMNAAVDAGYLRQIGDIRLSLWRVMRFYGQYLARLLLRRRIPVPNIDDVVEKGCSDLELARIPHSQKPQTVSSRIFVPLFLNPLTRRVFYPLMAVAVARAIGGSWRRATSLTADHLSWSLKRILRLGEEPISHQSLRKTVKTAPTANEDADRMIPLRLGR